MLNNPLRPRMNARMPTWGKRKPHKKILDYAKNCKKRWRKMSIRCFRRRTRLSANRQVLLLRLETGPPTEGCVVGCR